MPGGKFDYKEYFIQYITEIIQEELDQQGTEKPIETVWDREYFKDHPDEKFYPFFPKEIEEKLKEGVEVLKKAYVYAKAIDRYLSYDIGEESFFKELEEGLNQLNNERADI